MASRHNKRARRRATGTILFILGIFLWVITATVSLSPFYARLASLGNAEQLSLGVVVGGAFVAAGIIRLATSA